MITSPTSFHSFQRFQAVYGQEPHLGCYLIKIEKAMSSPWWITLIINGKELREVSVAMASKKELIPWCRKSQKILRFNMKQIIGDGPCRI